MKEMLLRHLRHLNLCLFCALFIAIPGCNCFRTRVEPKAPAIVRGWKTVERAGVTSIGEFLLKKGESTNNGAVAVTIDDIIPPDACADPNSWNGSPKVVFKFTRLSDNTLLCTTTMLDGGNGLLGNDCGDKLDGVSAMTTYEVNSREKWVHFELLK